MGPRRPKVVDVAVREARQPLEANLAEHLVLSAQQFAGGYPRHLAKRLAGLRQQRARPSVETLIGRTISEATLLKYVLRLQHALAGWERSTVEQLLAMPAMHVNETSLRVDQKNHWIPVCAAGEITLKFLHPRRGREAINALGVIPRYGGAVVHDGWASCLTYYNCDHGLCGSHLLRELTFVVDSNHYAWARNRKRLLQETCFRVSQREQKKLTESEYKNLRKRYRNILTRG